MSHVTKYYCDRCKKEMPTWGHRLQTFHKLFWWRGDDQEMRICEDCWKSFHNWMNSK